MLPPMQTPVLDWTTAEAIARRLRMSAFLKDFRQISAKELSGVIDHLVELYIRWTAGDQSQVAECSRYFANVCFRLSVPMVEAAYGLFLIRDELPATISAENEMGRGEPYPRLTEFFNLVILDLLEEC
jgi:hypothetical protein